MQRVAKILFTLPLLGLPLAALAPKAGAEAVTQLDALRLLAKSRAADDKCKVLAPGEAEELRGYMARAEVAAATRNSVSEVQSIISLGKALGATASCSPQTTAEIGATVAAARQAMSALERPRQSADEGTVQAGKETPATRIGERKTQAQRRGGLAAYGRQAFAYYVERRCGYLSRRDIRAFWTAVIREHKAAMSVYGGPAVASTLRRARSQADGMSCDAADSRHLVQSEYIKLARN
jgi:hypothetical protein